MGFKLVLFIAVLTLVGSSNAEISAKMDSRDSPMIQERRCLPAGKTCVRGPMRVPCCGSCSQNKCT
uniref:U2-theraphotoxin-Pc1a n=1 Tax=Psalmopoeus cambridgei TaxID=179874 RepID=TXFK2_PSACA|nr:RecName: Full=U2-theraphotoxin-Pc1a; Short=U2-TRTX-Pc1a; AltName: Full=Psalmopeotoxin II; AltName: Full=Psalmopeotoxin-2; AltName: Full=Psalmopoeus cambridgei Falciparum killer 2; Short=PcFK2; Flags: Precursor [Psalmopoeus cambridgei]